MPRVAEESYWWGGRRDRPWKPHVAQAGQEGQRVTQPSTPAGLQMYLEGVFVQEGV